MEQSKISWTDHTFNPWIGCTKVSPGCANCYAATQDKLRKWTPEGWGKGKPRKRTKTWSDPVKWNAGAAKTGARTKVFCASLADWLDDEVPTEWLADLLVLIHKTPHLDWLLLTKRPENWRARMEAVVKIERLGSHPGHIMAHQWLRNSLTTDVPHNVWIGTTVEDQERANERIPHLLKIPAMVRFLSCEPLLGPVDIADAFPKTGLAHLPLRDGVPCINWVIAGGESGPGHRVAEVAWFESLRSQCPASVAFFMKQDSGPKSGMQGRIPAELFAIKEFPRT